MFINNRDTTITALIKSLQETQHHTNVWKQWQPSPHLETTLPYNQVGPSHIWCLKLDKNPPFQHLPLSILILILLRVHKERDITLVLLSFSSDPAQTARVTYKAISTSTITIRTPASLPFLTRNKFASFSYKNHYAPLSLSFSYKTHQSIFPSPFIKRHLSLPIHSPS